MIMSRLNLPLRDTGFIWFNKRLDSYLQPVREQCPLPEQKRRQAGPIYTAEASQEEKNEIFPFS